MRYPTLLAFLTIFAGAAALPARAQFQPMEMELSGFPSAVAATGPIQIAGGTSDLLLLGVGNATTPAQALYGWRSLLAPMASPYALPAAASSAALAHFDGTTAAGARPDLAWLGGRTVLVDWGAAPGTAASLTLGGISSPVVVHAGAAIRLLQRSEPFLVVDGGSQPGAQSGAFVYDLAAARGLTAVSPAWQDATLYGSADDGIGWQDRIYPIQVSPAATSLGVSDAVMPLQYGFRLLWNQTAAGATAVGPASLASVYVGPTVGVPLASLLEPGLQLDVGASAMGVAAVDVDGDGVRDLVFSYGGDGLIPWTGRLLWLRNTGDPAALSTATWHDLAARPDLQPIVDPVQLRQLDLPGAPAFAVVDRALHQIIVVQGNGAAGFSVVRLPTFGARVRDFWTADVVGSTAPDLLAWVTLPGGAQKLWVYPDVGDLAPSLAWSPAPPAEALAGVDLPLAVAASDVDTPFTVTWTRSTAPAASAAGSSLKIPGSELCAQSGSVDVGVVALDTLGVFRRLTAAIPIVGRPSLVLPGTAPAGRVALLPGGTPLREEGLAWPACGSSPSFTWTETDLPGLIVTGGAVAGSSTWRTVTVPEAAYPAALGGAPAVSLTASESLAAPVGTLSGTARIPLDLDGAALTAVDLSFDGPALAAGEVGTARATISSRIGVPLPAVRASIRLVELELAGPISAAGATAVPGAVAGDVVLDALPARGGTVVLRIPVRAGGTPGGASVELFSSGGFRLSPPAAPSADAGAPPGCGCGAGDPRAVPPALLALLLVLALRRRPT